jgi:hypothetical protein
MFSFSDANPKMHEQNVVLDEMESKYHDKYMIAMNVTAESEQLRGDIAAILSPEEYAELRKSGPKRLAPKYTVLEGVDLKLGGLGVYGIYL